MKRSLIFFVSFLFSTVFLLIGCSIPVTSIGDSSKATDSSGATYVSLSDSDIEAEKESAIDFLIKRNELPYYSIDDGASIVADKYDREVLRQVILLEKAAYLYGMAKASQNPDEFLAQKAEELRLRAAELPQEFGNTALFREQAAMSTLQGSVELAREYLTYNEEFFSG
jgi:hypothetical protein